MSVANSKLPKKIPPKAEECGGDGPFLPDELGHMDTEKFLNSNEVDTGVEGLDTGDSMPLDAP